MTDNDRLSRPVLVNQEPKDPSFLDELIEEKDVRKRAEERVADFKRIALRWCERAGIEHRDAARNRRAFLLATAVSAFLVVAALAGWVR
jgi:hypothetical protein